MSSIRCFYKCIQFEKTKCVSALDFQKSKVRALKIFHLKGEKLSAQTFFYLIWRTAQYLHNTFHRLVWTIQWSVKRKSKRQRSMCEDWHWDYYKLWGKVTFDGSLAGHTISKTLEARFLRNNFLSKFMDYLYNRSIFISFLTFFLFHINPQNVYH